MSLHYSVNPDWLDRPIDIWLIGVGGNGSEMLDILARMHAALKVVGHPHGFRLTAWDGDTVSPSNIVRQRFWHTDIGENKALVSVQRLNLFLGLGWDALPVPFDPERQGYHLPDIIISCVDSAKMRVEIARYYAESESSPWPGNELLWLDLGNGESTAQMILGHLSTAERNTIRLPHVYDLHPELADIDDHDAPSCSAEESLAQQTFGVNKTVAVSAGNLLWSLLTQPSVSYHGAYLNSRDNTTQPIRIDPSFWESIGYKHYRCRLNDETILEGNKQ